MAKNTTASDFRQILTNVRNKKISPIYILMGEEDYYIDRLVEALGDNILAEDERDFNFLTYYGADTDISTVIASAQQYPVFAERKVVFLKEAQTMHLAKNQLDKLGSYLERPNPSTVLVVTYKGENIPGTSSFIKKAVKNKEAVIFRSELVPEYMLSNAIHDYCADKGIKIDDKAASLLADYIGNPLSKLFGEIDKLIISIDDKSKIISSDTIENNIGISKDFNSFELTKAIGRRDYGRAMMIIEYFSRNPKNNPGVMIVTVLFNYFTKLSLALALKDKTDASLMKELDMKSAYALRDYRDALGRYNLKQAVQAIHFLREMDTQSKGIGSNKDIYDLLKEFIFKVFTVK